MTPSEVFRTAHEYVNTGANSFGAGLPHGINQVCRYCKSTDTQQPSASEMIPFNNFYKTKEFKAYACNVCGAKFSWYK